jgi:hypothetical protein
MLAGLAECGRPRNHVSRVCPTEGGVHQKRLQPAALQWRQGIEQRSGSLPPRAGPAPQGQSLDCVSARQYQAVLVKFRNECLDNLHAVICRERGLRRNIFCQCHVRFGERRQIQMLHRECLVRSPSSPTACIVQES